MALALGIPTAIAAHAAIVGGHPETDTIHPSPFGKLVYDASTRCAKNSRSEVGFVGNRVIVTTASPAAALTSINDWLKTNGPLGGAGARAVAAEATPKAWLVGTITLPRPDDDVAQLTPVRAYRLPGADPYDILSLARFLRERGHESSPDYVARPQHHHFWMPDGLPEATTDLVVPRAPFGGGGALGQGVGILVTDTGISNPGRIPNATPLVPSDVEVPDSKTPGRADNGAVGHGQASSSVIWGLVPGSAIVDAKVMKEGLSTDWTAAKRIVDILKGGNRPNMILASWGTEACDIDPLVGRDELLPLSLRGAADWIAQLSPHQAAGIALIGAAGNHGTTRRQYPAAFPSAIAVGAIDATLDGDNNPLSSSDRTGHVAAYSGRGGWVDAYAPGTEIVSLHVGRPGAGIDFAQWDHPDDPAATTVLEGRALSTGTSFSVSVLSGALAEVMTQHNEGVWDAWARLQQQRISPLWPCDGSSGAITGVAVVWKNVTQPITRATTVNPSNHC